MTYPIQNIIETALLDDEFEANLNFQQNKVLNNIINCKTSQMGGHTLVCNDCGNQTIHYNSCRDRHCPCCQTIEKEKWIDRMNNSLVDAPYFHIVATVPHELNTIFLSNQKIMYNLLYDSIAQTLKELAKTPKHKLLADIGFIAIIHTWGRNLSYHPHIHIILLGGGLNSNNEFVQRKGKFLFPFKVMKSLFRGKFLYKLNKLWINDKLDYKPMSDTEFSMLKSKLYQKDCVIYAKKTFNRANNVLKYLGNYTNRIAISNNRIVSYNNEYVTFKYKDFKTKSNKNMTLTVNEFVRRFSMHILPKGFVRIRHYGILSNRSKGTTLTLIKILINSKNYKSRLQNLTTAEIILKLFKKDINKCQKCSSKNITSHKIRRIRLE